MSNKLYHSLCLSYCLYTDVLYFGVFQLILDYGVDPVTTRLLDAYDFYIMPDMNPDGYEYSYQHVCNVVFVIVLHI